MQFVRLRNYVILCITTSAVLLNVCYNLFYYFWKDRSTNIPHYAMISIADEVDEGQNDSLPWMPHSFVSLKVFQVQNPHLDSTQSCQRCSLTLNKDCVCVKTRDLIRGNHCFYGHLSLCIWRHFDKLLTWGKKTIPEIALECVRKRVPKCMQGSYIVFFHVKSLTYYS